MHPGRVPGVLRHDNEGARLIQAYALLTVPCIENHRGIAGHQANHLVPVRVHLPGRPVIVETEARHEAAPGEIAMPFPVKEYQDSIAKWALEILANEGDTSYQDFSQRFDEVKNKFDSLTLARFGLYLLIPVASWVGSAFVERVVDTALD